MADGCSLLRPVRLHLGRWEDALAHVRSVDTLISDPPYGPRTHRGQLSTRYDASTGLAAQGLGYDAWTPADVRAFVQAWSWRVRGWFCVFCSHDLVQTYTTALEREGRYVFAPVACVQRGQNVRLQGDGPSNWTTYLVPARPRGLRAWGALPGAYVGTPYDVGQRRLERAQRAARGSKPLWLMRSVVADYSRAGGLVVDPCAGRGTTLAAACLSGRSAVGAEADRRTYEGALEYLRQTTQLELAP